MLKNTPLVVVLAIVGAASLLTLGGAMPAEALSTAVKTVGSNGTDAGYLDIAVDILEYKVTEYDDFNFVLMKLSIENLGSQHINDIHLYLGVDNATHYHDSRYRDVYPRGVDVTIDDCTSEGVFGTLAVNNTGETSACFMIPKESEPEALRLGWYDIQVIPFHAESTYCFVAWHNHCREDNIRQVDGTPEPAPEPPNLERADLAGEDLVGIDLTGANLRYADLSGANLRDAVLFGADLTGADLTGANLHDAILIGANLRIAHLDGADLAGAHLSDARLTDVNLSNANLTGANLRGADLANADLASIRLNWANLWGADLSGAGLANANLTGANLNWADLSDADLGDADLRYANLHNADLGDADLRYANLHSANLPHANLSGADLRNANFLDAYLGDADLLGVDLTGANALSFLIRMSGAQLYTNTLTYAVTTDPDHKDKSLKSFGNTIGCDQPIEITDITVDTVDWKLSGFVIVKLEYGSNEHTLEFDRDASDAVITNDVFLPIYLDNGELTISGEIPFKDLLISLTYNSLTDTVCTSEGNY